MTKGDTSPSERKNWLKVHKRNIADDDCMLRKKLRSRTLTLSPPATVKTRPSVTPPSKGKSRTPSVSPPSKGKSRALGSPTMTCSDEDEVIIIEDEFSDLEKTMEATLMFPRLDGNQERLELQCLRNVDGEETRRILCEEWKVLLLEELQLKIRKQNFAARLADAQLSA